MPAPQDKGLRPDWPIVSLDLSPDGCRLVASDNMQELVLIDVPTWTVVASLHDGVANHTWRVAFVDDRRFVYCGADDALHLWDGQGEPSKLATFEGGNEDCQTIAVDRENSRIAVVGFHGGVPPNELRVFGVDGSVLGKRKIPGPFSPALRGDWFTGLDDIAMNASSRASRSFVEWSKNRPATTAPPSGISFAGLGDAKQLLAVGPNGILGLVDAVTGTRRELGHEHGVPRTGVFSRDGSRLFVFFQADGARGKSGIATFDMPALTEIRFEPETWASDYRVSENGRWVLATDGMNIVFLDAKTGARLASGPTNRPGKP